MSPILPLSLSQSPLCFPNKERCPSKFLEEVTGWWSEEGDQIEERASEKLIKLLTINSLTAGLKSLRAPFSVTLLRLQREKMGGQEYFIRDVFLNLAGTPVVWARSAINPEASAWRKILNCGERPLGAQLFDGSLPLSRSPFYYGVVERESALFSDDLNPLLATDYHFSTIGRYSQFLLEGAPLDLVEYYLPALNQFLRQ